MPKDIADLTRLPRYYTYKEVLALYGDDEDAFMDAWCDNTLPLDIRRTCESTLTGEQLTNWLLRRMVRQLNQIIELLTPKES